MAESRAVKARDFANELIACPQIDWISITDNAGGNPQLAPLALGRPVLYAGKEVVIHLTCKDLNRNGLESEAWMLNSEGFHNILAMTGDYPVAGNEGMAKPVFDIDSVGLISLLNKMNQRPRPERCARQRQKPATWQNAVLHRRGDDELQAARRRSDAAIPEAREENRVRRASSSSTRSGSIRARLQRAARLHECITA